MCCSGLCIGVAGFALCMRDSNAPAGLRFAGLIIYLIGIVCAHAAHRRWLIFSQRWDVLSPPPRGAIPGGSVATPPTPPQPVACLPAGCCGRIVDFAAPFPTAKPGGLPSAVREQDWRALSQVINERRARTQRLMDLAPLFYIFSWLVCMACFAAALRRRRGCGSLARACVLQWAGFGAALSFFASVVLWKALYCLVRARCLRLLGAFLEAEAERTGLAAEHNMRWVIRSPPFARYHAAPTLWLVIIDPERRAVERLGWRDAFTSRCGQRFQRQVRCVLCVSARLRGAPVSLADELWYETLGFLPKGDKYRPYPTITDRLGV